MIHELPNIDSLRTAASRFEWLGDQWAANSQQIDTCWHQALGAPWTGEVAAAFDRVASHVHGDTTAARNAFHVVASELRAVANVVEGLHAEHQSLAGQTQDIAYSLSPSDAIRRVHLDEQIHRLETAVVARMNAAAAEIRRQAGQAHAAEKASRSSDLWHKLGRTLSSAAKDLWHAARSVGSFGVDVVEGAVTSVIELANLGWKTSIIHLQTDPVGYARDMKQLAEGYLRLGEQFWHDPGNTAFRVFDIDTLEQHPGRWVGGLVPGLLLGAGIGGVGAKAGTRVAVSVAEGAETDIAAVAAANVERASLTAVPKAAAIELNGYTFETDILGRVVRARGTLRLQPGASVPKDLAAEVRTLGQPGDHAGHLIAKVFDGPADFVNLVPQDANLNMGQWRVMEMGWMNDLKAGKRVEVVIEAKYTDIGGRAESFNVRWAVDGTRNKRTFWNAPGGSPLTP